MVKVTGMPVAAVVMSPQHDAHVCGRLTQSQKVLNANKAYFTKAAHLHRWLGSHSGNLRTSTFEMTL